MVRNTVLASWTSVPTVLDRPWFFLQIHIQAQQRHSLLTSLAFLCPILKVECLGCKVPCVGNNVLAIPRHLPTSSATLCYLLQFVSLPQIRLWTKSFSASSILYLLLLELKQPLLHIFSELGLWTKSVFSVLYFVLSPRPVLGFQQILRPVKSNCLFW